MTPEPGGGHQGDDVIERDRDQAVERLARLYLVLSRVNAAIEHADDERALLQAACEIVVEVGRFRMSWAGIADPSTGVVTPVARAGFDEGYSDLVRIELRGPRSKGPTGQALVSGRPIVCDDIATDPRMEPWRAEALRRGYHSSVGLPLIVRGATFGVLTAYADEPHRFDGAAMELIEELGRDVSIGVATLAGAAEGRRAAMALAASEERFRTSIQTLLDPFIILRAVRDESGTIVDFEYEYANEAACRYNQMSQDELIGSRVLQILPEHSATGLFDTYVGVVETGEPLILDDVEYEDTWGGVRTRRVFDIRASKLGDGLAYTWRDVTERRNAARRRSQELERRVRERTAELETARERASAIADLTQGAVQAATGRDIAVTLLEIVRRTAHAADGNVVLVDCDGWMKPLSTFGLPSGAVEKIERTPPGEATPVREVVRLGKPLILDSPDEFASRYPAIGAFTGVAMKHARVVLPLPAGDDIIGAVSLGFERPRSFDEAELAYFLSLANIAAHALERLRLTTSERETRELLEAVVAQMPVGVSLVAANGAVMYRNDALERIYGPLPGDRPQPDGFHADGRPYAADEWPSARSLATGEIVVNEEIAVHRPDDTSVTVMQTSAPVKDASGNAMAAVVVTLDITERKQAEALRDAFVGVLSHELRTPVTTIYGGAGMLASRGGRLDAETRESLIADIASESERLTHLVDDLLVLARAERGVDMTARGAALVQHRLRAVIRSLEPVWPTRRFIADIPDHVPPVTGDEAYLEQVFRNLLGNAAKYGRSEVVARVERCESSVRVTVLDDGRGIAPEDLDHVFDLFFRASATKTLPGAGIGLFVARGLVEGMGGEVTVANRPEGGAAFTVTLPEFREHRED